MSSTATPARDCSTPDKPIVWYRVVGSSDDCLLAADCLTVRDFTDRDAALDLASALDDPQLLTFHSDTQVSVLDAAEIVAECAAREEQR